MENTIQWEDAAHTLIRQTYYGGVGAAELRTMSEQNADLMKSVDYAVDLIIDATDAIIRPMQMFMLPKTMNDLVPPNQRLLVIISSSKLFQENVLPLARKMAPKTVKNLYMVDVLQSAYELIDNYRASIDEAPLKLLS